MLSIDEIKSLLKHRFTEIDFLESTDKAKRRYEINSTVLFSIEKKVVKFFSIQGKSKKEIEREKESLFSEYSLLKKLQKHSSIIRVFKLRELTHKGNLIGFYLEFERVKYTLRDLLERGRKFSSQEVINFLQQMDSVLNALHVQNDEPIIHSDIKPSNIGIKFRENGEIRYILMDFGVSVSAKNSKQNYKNFSIKGLTPAYSAPEQISAYDTSSGFISTKVDIYATGVIALEMLTGAPPKKDENSVYYQLPLLAVPDMWRETFKQLCHTDSKKRVDRISKALHEFEYKISDRVQSVDREIVKNADNERVSISFKKIFASREAGYFSGFFLLFLFVYGAVKFFTIEPKRVSNISFHDTYSEVERLSEDEFVDDRGISSRVYNDNYNSIPLDGLQETKTGLKYRVIKEGRGIRPGPNSDVKFHYTYSLPSGRVIGSSQNQGTPFYSSVNLLRNEIVGLAEGLQLMNEGAKYEFVIPGYLSFSNNREVIFEVELIDVE